MFIESWFWGFFRLHGETSKDHYSHIVVPDALWRKHGAVFLVRMISR